MFPNTDYTFSNSVCFPSLHHQPIGVSRVCPVGTLTDSTWWSLHTPSRTIGSSTGWSFQPQGVEMATPHPGSKVGFQTGGKGKSHQTALCQENSSLPGSPRQPTSAHMLLWVQDLGGGMSTFHWTIATSNECFYQLAKKFLQFLSKNERHIFHFPQELYWTTYSIRFVPLPSAIFRQVHNSIFPKLFLFEGKKPRGY